MATPVINYGPVTFAGITIDIQPCGGIADPIWRVWVNGQVHEANSADEIKAIIARAYADRYGWITVQGHPLSNRYGVENPDFNWAAV